MSLKPTPEMITEPSGSPAQDVTSAENDSTLELRRGLSNRHIQMIALGGAIGVGLFLYSSEAIHRAGPALLICYLFGGSMIFLIARALGELALYRPVSGSFATYADEFIGPRAGFFTGWTYWAAWIAAAMIELTAIGIYVDKYLFPGVPQWLSAIVVLGLVYAINLLPVRFFGESEFWFAILKVFAILLMIFIGIAVLTFGFSSLGKTASVSNLWKHGGLFPNGYFEPLVALQFAAFSFMGVELVGIAAGEAKDPQVTLPKAINSVAIRIVVFYVGSLAVIMSLVPWNTLIPGESPFVLVFSQAGIPAASQFVTAIVLTAALSAGNSCMFSTGRMLYGLAAAGHAPRRLTEVNRNGVPFAAISVSAAVMLIGVAINYIVPEDAFAYIAAVTIIGALAVWGMIVIAHLGYQRAIRAGRIKRGNFRLPGAPFINYVLLAFLLLVAVLLGFNEQSRVALYVAPFWFALICSGYWITKNPEFRARLRRTVTPSPAAGPLPATTNSEDRSDRTPVAAASTTSPTKGVEPSSPSATAAALSETSELESTRPND